MKLCLCQMEIIHSNPDKNIITAEKYIQVAADRGCDLILLPEFWAVGFDLANVAELADESDGGIFKIMSTWAMKYKIAICGTHPQKKDGYIYNSAVFYNKQGELTTTYDKMHLFSPLNENKYIRPGCSLPQVFDTEWGKIGLIICFDLRFPEIIRRLALEGAELILIPAYWPQPRLDHWSLFLQARAIENQVYIAGCNRAKGNSKLEFGRSAVISPGGNHCIQGGIDPMLLTANVSFTDVNENRNEFPAFKSRRSGEYGIF